jgi:hypothetical protein
LQQIPEKILEKRGRSHEIIARILLWDKDATLPSQKNGSATQVFFSIGQKR